MKKEISVAEFCDELIKRIDASKNIECCHEEIKNLASLAKKHMNDKKIEVFWKD